MNIRYRDVRHAAMLLAGKGNVILFLAAAARIAEAGKIRTGQQLVGLFKFYYREAA